MTTNIARAVEVICDIIEPAPNEVTHWAVAQALAAANLLAPEPHVVTSVEDVEQMFADGCNPFAIRDRAGILWLMWENGGGDIFTTSWPEEDQVDGRDAVPLEDFLASGRSDVGVRFPATVLSPAPAPAPRVTVTREQVLDALWGAARLGEDAVEPEEGADAILALLTAPAEKDGAE